MNKHYEKARTLLNFSTEGRRGITKRASLVMRGWAEATLALTYAQDTANLIAAFSEGGLNEVGGIRIDRAGLSDRIMARLDLG